MWKVVLAGTTALAIAGSSLVYAQQRNEGDQQQQQQQQHWQFTQQDRAAFAAARIAALKAGLALNADQEKNWPAYESALKNLSQYRQQQRQAMRGEQPAADPTERLRRAADRLSGFGAALKRLADAQAPLYNSLDPAQKRRFGILEHMLRHHHWHHAWMHGERHGMHNMHRRAELDHRMGGGERGERGFRHWRQQQGSNPGDQNAPQLNGPVTNGQDEGDSL